MAGRNGRYDGAKIEQVTAVVAHRIFALPQREHVIRRGRERAAAETAKRPVKARDKAIVALFGAAEA